MPSRLLVILSRLFVIAGSLLIAIGLFMSYISYVINDGGFVNPVLGFLIGVSIILFLIAYMMRYGIRRE
jgi:hypothetical protein